MLFYTLAYIICSNVVCIRWDEGWLHRGLFCSPEVGGNTCITGYFETESRVNNNNNNYNIIIIIKIIIIIIIIIMIIIIIEI